MEAELMDVIQDLRQEMTKLRAENRALRDEIHRERQQVPPPVPPTSVPQLTPAYAPPPAYVPKRVARRVLDNEGVTVSNVLRLKTPEFMGEHGDDPQEFLDETKKMVRPLQCSDARVIELVGIKLKKNAWDWF